MTIDDLRTIPLHLEPVPGECITGWMHAWANRLHLSYGHLCELAGLSHHASGPRPDYAGHLTTDDAARLAKISGIPSDRLHDMTLARWEGTFVELDDTQKRFRVLKPWTTVADLRVCSGCMSENSGRWLLRWYLPWSFACVRHRQLLLTRCPRCGRTLSRHVTRHGAVNSTATCNARKHSDDASSTCGYVFADTPPRSLHSDDPIHAGILSTQQSLDSLIDRTPSNTNGLQPEDSRTEHPITPQQIRQTLIEIATLARKLGSTGLTAESVHAPLELRQPSPQHPDATDDRVHSDNTLTWQAAGITHALHAMQAGPDAVPTLAEMLHRERTRRGNTGPATIHRDWDAAPRLRDTLVSLALINTRRPVQIRWRATTPLQAPPDLTTEDVARRAAATPAALWPEVAIDVLPTNTARVELARTTLAAALMLPGAADARLGPTARHLDLPPRAFSKDSLHSIGIHRPDLATVLTGLADTLDNSTPAIDYQRRRHLPTTGLLTLPEWRTIADHAGAAARSLRRHRFARYFVYQRLTGSPFTRPPRSLLTNTQSDRDGYAIFCDDDLTPHLRHALDAHATKILRNNGIEEPLAWAPHAASKPTVPIRQWFDAWVAGKSVRQIAESTGWPISLVRLTVLLADPVPADIISTPPAPKPTMPRRTNTRGLTEQLLRSLIAQHCSVTEIAARTRTSRYAVDLRLNELGILRPATRDRYGKRQLHQLYVTERLTTAQIATELGVTAPTVIRHLKLNGITPRPRGTVAHRAALTEPPQHVKGILRRALTGAGIYGDQRLQRFVLLAGHDTIEQAARWHGFSERGFIKQLYWLEKATGTRLLVRAEKHRPMRYTAAGHRLAKAAVAYLT